MSHSIDESIRLFERYRADDSQAADELFQRYVTRLTGLVRARMSPKLAKRLDAEDVVQSAYRSFFRGAERKKNAKTQAKRTPKREKETRSKSQNGQPEVKLSKEQQARVAALKKEFGQLRAELQKQLDDLLTDEQTQAKDVARKNALAEGKGGVKLRTAMDQALNLTPNQQKNLNELRQTLRQLTRSQRAEIEKVRRRLEDREN